MSEANKAIIRRLYDAINAGDVNTIAAAMADDFVEHEAFPGLPPTKEGTLQLFKMMREAFSGLAMVIEDIIAEGDKVFVRATMKGTQKGEFLGIPSSGKTIAVPLADFLLMKKGQITEHWGVMDSGAMMQQLGAMPS